MKTLIVNEKYDNKKLNTILKDMFPSITNGLFYKTLRKKDIKINGKRISENVTVFINDKIDIYINDSLLLCNCNIHIIYEDDNIVILNKPSGIEVMGDYSLTSVLTKDKGYRVFPCHRLDRNTTGIIVFAKTEETLSILLDKFKNSEVEKHYIAHVFGIPKKSPQTLTAYLFKDAKKSTVYISNNAKKGYRKIVTSFEIIKKFDNNSCLLDVNLHTGRTHQIRAHLAYIGFPIIGDGKYGNNNINKLFNAKSQKLCSYKIKFNFCTDSGVLNYLNGKEFCIDYDF